MPCQASCSPALPYAHVLVMLSSTLIRISPVTCLNEYAVLSHTTLCQPRYQKTKAQDKGTQSNAMSTKTKGLYQMQCQSPQVSGSVEPEIEGRGRRGNAGLYKVLNPKA